MPKYILDVNKDNWLVFSIRQKAELIQGLDELCKSTGHTRNKLIGFAIQFFLENVEVAPPTADKKPEA